MITLIWIISLIVLIASCVFVYKMLITSSELLSPDKRVVSKLSRIDSRDKFLRQSLDNLNAKMRALEDTNVHYSMQFTRLQAQLADKGLPGEAKVTGKTATLPSYDDVVEDWEEMYYEENEARVQLENELDVLSQKLKIAGEKNAELQAKNQVLMKRQSDYDSQLDQIATLTNQIEILESRLPASVKREKEITRQVQNGINQKNPGIQSENARLRSEVDNQRKQMVQAYRQEGKTAGKPTRYAASTEK